MNSIETLLANILVNTFWQSLTVGLFALLILRFMRRRAASERALVALCAIIVLAMLPVANAVSQAHLIDRLLAPPAVSTIPAEGNKPVQASLKPLSLAPIRTKAVSMPKIELKGIWKKYVNAAILPLALIWAAGTLLLLVRLFYGLIFLRGFRFGLKQVSDSKVDKALAQTSEILPLRRMPPVFTSPAATSPLTVGIFRPVMILPEKLLDSLSENEICSIVLHEFSHVWRRDHLIGVFKRLIIAVNWWNPAVYFINSIHADAAEELSDNCALLQMKPEEYSECLIQLAEKTGLISRLPATIAMSARSGSLHQRVLKLLAKDRRTDMKTTLFKKFAALTAIVAVILIAGVMGCISTQSQTTAKSSGSITYWDKYKLWDILRKGGNKYIVKDEAKTKQLLTELTNGVWLVKLEPVNGFKPSNASVFLKEINKHTEARSGSERIGGASFFRTTFNGKVLIGSFLSETPEVLKKDFSNCKTIKFISSEPVTPELFDKYVDSIQESVKQNSKTLKKDQKQLSQSAPQTVVVKTFPTQGQTVKADAVKELRVTFSNDMNTSGSWAFCSEGKYFFPGGNSKPHWLDERTCALPVKLIPGRTYSVTFNAGRFVGFYDIANRPSVSYKLIFKTEGKSAETVIADKPKVISTFPRHGDLVDASKVKEIRVTFNEDMNTSGLWSFFPRGNTASDFYKTSDKAHWLDKRTFAIPVKLSPGKEYYVWFNMGNSYRDFINTKGNSSIPYYLGFSTK